MRIIRPTLSLTVLTVVALAAAVTGASAAPRAARSGQAPALVVYDRPGMTAALAPSASGRISLRLHVRLPGSATSAPEFAFSPPASPAASVAALAAALGLPAPGAARAGVITDIGAHGQLSVFTGGQWWWTYVPLCHGHACPAGGSVVCSCPPGATCACPDIALRPQPTINRQAVQQAAARIAAATWPGAHLTWTGDVLTADVAVDGLPIAPGSGLEQVTAQGGTRFSAAGILASLHPLGEARVIPAASAIEKLRSPIVPFWGGEAIGAPAVSVDEPAPTVTAVPPIAVATPAIATVAPASAPSTAIASAVPQTTAPVSGQASAGSGSAATGTPPGPTVSGPASPPTATAPPGGSPRPCALVPGCRIVIDVTGVELSLALVPTSTGMRLVPAWLFTFRGGGSQLVLAVPYRMQTPPVSGVPVIGGVGGSGTSVGSGVSVGSAGSAVSGSTGGQVTGGVTTPMPPVTAPAS